MSEPGSRKELEQALRALRTGNQPLERSPRRSIDDIERPQRRQAKVLGGDPSGVKSKSFGHTVWSRITTFGLINTAAALMVTVIMVAFFWPTNPKGVKEIALADEQLEAANFYSESRIDDIPELTESVNQTFVRETDIERADDYREQEYVDSRTEELLAQAEIYLTEGAYTHPAGANASEAYQQILALNPNNVDAQRGLDYIKGRFLSTGSAAAQAGNLTEARSTLERLGVLDETSPEYTELAGLIEAAEMQAQIARLLERAESAFAAENYILPAQNNAWSFYQQVLELDPDNTAAQNGRDRVANTYIQLANDAALAGEYQAAAGYLATVGVIDPNNASIPIIEQIISTAQPLANRAAEAAQNNSAPNSTTQNTVTEPDSAQQSQQSPEQDTDGSPQTAQTANEANQTVSQSRTPSQEAAEQAAFDRQYLDRGLAAYYQGDYDTAVSLLTPLADKGISRAQFRIAYMHYLGRGFERDRNEADRIIRAALPAIQQFAAEGRAWAQSDLGSLYEDGLVLPRDYKEAVFWYRAAAEQGYAGAQTNLGILYARGLGVTTSRNTAIEWFEKAAAQGDAAATRNLEALGVN